MIRIDHLGIPAKNPEASAKWLAQILGAGAPSVDGADDDMFRIELSAGSFVLFSAAEKVDVLHLAFRVEVAAFQGVLERLRALAVPFGNEPHDTRNGRTDDPLGGAGRVYFLDENGHLFEVTC